MKKYNIFLCKEGEIYIIYMVFCYRNNVAPQVQLRTLQAWMNIKAWVFKNGIYIIYMGFCRQNPIYTLHIGILKIHTLYYRAPTPPDYPPHPFSKSKITIFSKSYQDFPKLSTIFYIFQNVWLFSRGYTPS